VKSAIAYEEAGVKRIFENDILRRVQACGPTTCEYQRIIVRKWDFRLSRLRV
jgi:hypothetical protein